MVRLIKIFFALGAMALAACSSEDEIKITQSEKIVAYLERSHNPKLIAEGSESLEPEPAFYTTTIIGGAYRYIRTYYDADRDQKALINANSTITMTMWCYNFSNYQNPTDATLYYSNDPAYKPLFEDAGLNTEYWSFEPVEVDLSDADSILKGLGASLEGCRDGDYVEVYLTYDVAYGDKDLGALPKESAVAVYCQIESVN